MNLLPAILIGGPPHSGKSVLAYSLSQALRQRGVEHYVLRAYPDGEGDWSNEAPPRTVRLLRQKGLGTPQWVAHICRDVANRHLPLIVDVGGRPTPEQEAILDECTHAILLTPDDEAHAAWQAMLARHGLIIAADLRSQLRGRQVLTDAGPVLRGIITGLERGRMAAGPVFDALLERVAALFDYSPEELRLLHLAAAPVEIVVELPRLARTLGADPNDWQPRFLPAVLDYLPAETPLALYGRGPNWLYAAIALHVLPASLYQFDPRLGWVAPPRLRLGTPGPGSPLQAHLLERAAYTLIEFAIQEAYLDYREAEGLVVPHVSPASGIVLSGKLPLWLWTSLSQRYADLSWLAVYHPRWANRALLVRSSAAQKVGQMLPLGNYPSGENRSRMNNLPQQKQNPPAV